MKAIMYHYVRPDDPALPYFRHMTVDNFERQLDFFEESHRLISRDEFIHALETKSPVNGVVLTFDDGVKDHFEHAYRVLSRRNLFGIFYIPTYPYRTGKILDVHRTHLLLGRVGGKAVLDRLLPKISDEMLSHTHVSEFRNQTYRIQTNDAWTNQVKRTLNYFIDYRHRSKVLDELMQEFVPDEAEVARDFYLSHEQMREMHEGGMLIGSHTETHPCMSKLSVTEQAREINDSFSFLESILGPLTPRTFCYPYGGFHSFTNETEQLLNTAGCLFSFNVEHRDIEQKDLEHRRQALPRYDCIQFPPIKSAPQHC